VNRSLTYDGSGGYSIVFEKMNKEKENENK
jgi:uncharacterized protein YerC